MHCIRHLHPRPPLGRKPLSKIAACNLPLIAALRGTCMLLHCIIRFVSAYFNVFLSALGIVRNLSLIYEGMFCSLLCP